MSSISGRCAGVNATGHGLASGCRKIHTVAMSELQVLDLGDGVVEVVGEVDAHGVDLLTDTLSTQQSDVVRVRLSTCSFMDSSALRVLLRAHADAGERGGRLVLVEPSDFVYRLLSITGLLEHFDIEPAR